MQISSVSQINNFKSNDNVYLYNKKRKYSATKNFSDDLMFKNEKTNSHSVTKFFLTTLGLSVLSYFATKKASFFTIKNLEGKFPLFGILDNLGKKLNTKLDDIQKKFPEIETKDLQSFIKNNINDMATKIKDFGKKGLTTEEIDAFKKAYQTNDITILEAKNAIRKTIAGLFGLGAGATTISIRNKDTDKNGIPDKAEKKESTTKALIDALPSIAAATASMV